MDHQKLHELARSYDYIGVAYHSLKSGVIPSRISITGYDHDKWMELVHYAKNTYEFQPDDFFERIDRSPDAETIAKTFPHLKSSISLCNPCEDVAELYYDSGSHREALNDLESRFNGIAAPKTEQRIGLIRSRFGNLEVTYFEYKLPEHSLIPYLDSSTRTIHRQMIQNLNQGHDNGLYLLYGPPGTGKTSFIKDVISNVSRNTLFISPAFTGDLTSPELITLLMKHPDSILIIEDAESVLMERQADNSSAVSNLLNLTDGFLADFLNLTIICTFNTQLNNIDAALLRDGRLMGMHEFTKLEPDKARKIAAILGNEIKPERPLTLAEVCNSSMKSTEYVSSKVGFHSSK